MRQSWNEIRARAARFAEAWKDAHYERGESQTFYNEFFDVFGVSRRRVASFEEPVKKLGNERGFIDLLWKGVLLVEQKSAGRSLSRAKQQALDYFPGLKEHELPRFILVSDFQLFELHDLEGEQPVLLFRLADFAHHVERFAFVLGVQSRPFRDQDPVNIEAAEIMGKLHDALKASGYEGYALERFLVRLVFCLFADDTGIFEPRDIFYELLVQRTSPDGSDTGLWVSQLFEVLNQPESKRQRSLDVDLSKFPYVNGDLFTERLSMPAFDTSMRTLLLEACEFSWDAISPAIFGSLFQSVMKPDERRSSGAHYTTERNILKTIEPLFLDELRAELQKLVVRKDAGRQRALLAFQDKLASLKFLDPACGCGNFLIIAYRELRKLELDVLKALRTSTQLKLDVSTLSKVDVDQFYGIEIGEFAARIAEVALWMMDHIMNNRLSLEFGDSYARIPIKKSPHIKRADALEIDWSDVIPLDSCSYIFGNPPFGGSKFQTPLQRNQVRRIAQLGGSGGTLDYVSAWFLKAGEALQKSSAKIAFVATNSITQGEQVAQLWAALFERLELEISFAHRTFAWGSDARGLAQVHVVIVGLSKKGEEPAVKRLFSYPNIKGDPIESQHRVLTAYLFDGSNLKDSHLVIRETSRSLTGAPKMVIGSKPIDGGYLIFNDSEAAELLGTETSARPFLRPYIGGVEYLNGRSRWILALQNASPSQLARMPQVSKRLALVRDYRLGLVGPRKSAGDESVEIKTPGISSKSLANTPAEYHVTVIPNAPFLAVPENSSETREYLPIGWLSPPIIPSNKLRFIKEAELWHFGILTSAMHMAWLRYVGGRIKSDYQYGIGVVYNTFPWLAVPAGKKAKIEALAQVVLEVRSRYPDSTLAEMYDTTMMKKDLMSAHRSLDAAVDKLYRRSPFTGDRDRAEHLFGLYESAVMPLGIQTQESPVKRSSKKAARRSP